MAAQLFVIAGPNGAGKTTYVQQHVPKDTFIFNGDDVYARLLEKYPNYDPERLKGGVPQQMENDISDALSKRSDFAFETNYASEMSIEVTQTFANAGYETNLIYFGLDSVEHAAVRVDHRVALGGHDLTTAEIKYNFEKGLKLVSINLGLYDTVKFADTSIYGIAPIIAYYMSASGSMK